MLVMVADYIITAHATLEITRRGLTEGMVRLVLATPPAHARAPQGKGRAPARRDRVPLRSLRGRAHEQRDLYRLAPRLLSR